MMTIVSKQFRFIPLLALALCFGATLANAQNARVYFGVGYGTDSSVGQSTDIVTGATELAPKLDTTFGKLGGDFMITKQLGFGAETDFSFSKSNYLGLNTRPIFYDFNGVYIPFSGKWGRVVPEVQAGVGGVRMNFSYPSCNSISGCQSSLIASSSHFQVHVGAAVNIYATKHVFIRPAFDYHYVPNFFQYGSNSVPEYGASVGWSFAEH
jgi:hypothetical protein